MLTTSSIRRHAVALLAVAAVPMAAGAQAAAHPASHTAPTAAKAPYRAPAGAFTITAWDYAFDAPDTAVAGMTEITLLNKGPELHHVQLIRLDQGKTLSDVFAALQAGGPPPSWVVEVGGPNAPAPGGTSVASVDLKAGRYGVICFIPSPDGKPHVMKGMAREMVVVPAARAKAAVPAKRNASRRAAAPVTMTLSDYDFTLSAPLKPGKQRIRVTNTAAQSHEVFIVRLDKGRTAQNVLEWVEKHEGPPPGMPLGGTTAIATGGENIVSVNLEPGEYALLCFIPDAKDGKMHALHGMVKQVTVGAAGARATGL